MYFKFFFCWKLRIFHNILPYTFGHSYRLLSTGKRAYKQSRRGCHLFLPDLLEDVKRSQCSFVQRLVFTCFPPVLL